MDILDEGPDFPSGVLLRPSALLDCISHDVSDDFHERAVPGKEDARCLTLTGDIRVVNRVQAGKGLSGPRNSCNEADRSFLIPMGSVDRLDQGGCGVRQIVGPGVSNLHHAMPGKQRLCRLDDQELGRYGESSQA